MNLEERLYRSCAVCGRDCVNDLVGLNERPVAIGTLMEAGFDVPFCSRCLPGVVDRFTSRIAVAVARRVRAMDIHFGLDATTIDRSTLEEEVERLLEPMA